MTADHWHYASDIHGGAEDHHRHHDTEREIEQLRRDLAAAVERIRELEGGQQQLWTQIGNMPGGI